MSGLDDRGARARGRSKSRSLPRRGEMVDASIYLV